MIWNNYLKVLRNEACLRHVCCHKDGELYTSLVSDYLEKLPYKENSPYITELSKGNFTFNLNEFLFQTIFDGNKITPTEEIKVGSLTVNIANSLLTHSDDWRVEDKTVFYKDKQVFSIGCYDVITPDIFSGLEAHIIIRCYYMFYERLEENQKQKKIAELNALFED